MIRAVLPAALARLSHVATARFAARILTTADRSALAALRAAVVGAQLLQPDCYRFEAEQPGFPENHLGADGVGEAGLIVGLFDEATQALAAYGALTLAPPDPVVARLGEALQMPQTTCADIAFFSSAMVDNAWRGHGLHDHLIQFRTDVAQAMGRRHLVTTIWPGNHPSWGHMTARGFHGKTLLDVSGGQMRLILHRDLAAAPPHCDPLTRHVAALEDLPRQAALFAAGHWLWRRLRRDGAVFAELARPAPTSGVAGSLRPA